MTDLRQLCETLGIDETDARERIRAGRTESGSPVAMPWYAKFITGFGAWISGLVAIALGFAILGFLSVDSPGALVVLGAIYFFPGLWLLREVEQQIFATQLGIAVTAAGAAMIIAGIGFESEEAWAATVASFVLTAVVILGSRHRSLQFLTALLAAVVFVMTLIAEEVPYYFDIVALAGPIAVVLLLYPPRRDVQPTATVLLITMPMFGVFHGMGVRFWEVGIAGGWVARILYVAVFLWLAYIHWQRSTDDAVRYRLGIFVAAAVAVGLLLPPGGSACLVILMLAFILGSRPLAALGVLLQVHYIWRFYYDMQVTLLAKSGVMLAVGAVLIAAWWLMQRRITAEEQA